MNYLDGTPSASIRGALLATASGKHIYPCAAHRCIRAEAGFVNLYPDLEQHLPHRQEPRCLRDSLRYSRKFRLPRRFLYLSFLSRFADRLNSPLSCICGFGGVASHGFNDSRTHGSLCPVGVAAVMSVAEAHEAIRGLSPDQRALPEASTTHSTTPYRSTPACVLHHARDFGR